VPLSASLCMYLHILCRQQPVSCPPDVWWSAELQPKAVANSGSSESSVAHVPSFSRQTSLSTCLSVSTTPRLSLHARICTSSDVPVSTWVTLLSSFKQICTRCSALRADLGYSTLVHTQSLVVCRASARARIWASFHAAPAATPAASATSWTTRAARSTRCSRIASLSAAPTVLEKDRDLPGTRAPVLLTSLHARWCWCCKSCKKPVKASAWSLHKCCSHSIGLECSQTLYTRACRWSGRRSCITSLRRSWRALVWTGPSPARS
jgi:hypothetical protein